VDPEAQKKLVASLRDFTDAPTVNPSQTDFRVADPDHLVIQRFVRKRKGSWWQVPRDLKVDEDDDESGQPVVSYNKEARTLRIWVGNNPRPITQEVFSP